MDRAEQSGTEQSPGSASYQPQLQPCSDPACLPQLTRAAERGAGSVTKARQRIADASQTALDRWQDATLAGKVILDPEAWVFRVAANAAKRLGKQLRHLPDLDDLAEDSEEHGPALALEVDDAPHDLRKLLSEAAPHAYMRQQIRQLSRKQIRVVEHLSLPGMTFRRAAKELGMDRSGLRRMYGRALRSLRDLNKRSPPPP